MHGNMYKEFDSFAEKVDFKFRATSVNWDFVW